MKLLFVSTAVGPLGAGIAGGVELNLLNLAGELIRRGHLVHIAAVAGSQTGDVPLVAAVNGLPPAFAQHEPRDQPVVLPHPSATANLWEAVRALETDYDLIVNWGYDWLPLYLTPFLHTPVAHVISMGSLQDTIDAAIAGVLRSFPGTVAVHSEAQAQTFAGIEGLVILPCGMDLSAYTFRPRAEPYLAWIGRIVPEKGLEDAFAVAELTGLALEIMGRLQDEDYFEATRNAYPRAVIRYRGFLPTSEMQQILGRAQCLLVTPKWVEAFGNVVVEALACGVPVVAYRRGGPAEIVVDGMTGFLTPPDDPHAMAAAIKNLPGIDRACCRAHAETHYSLGAMATRFLDWFEHCMRIEVALSEIT